MYTMSSCFSLPSEGAPTAIAMIMMDGSFPGLGTDIVDRFLASSTAMLCGRVDVLLIVQSSVGYSYYGDIITAHTALPKVKLALVLSEGGPSPRRLTPVTTNSNVCAGVGLVAVNSNLVSVRFSCTSTILFAFSG